MKSGDSMSLPSGREVLVVEDETRIRNMLGAALREMGFAATLVPSAEAAQREIAEKSFDILILDLNLSGIGGMELLENIRKRDRDIQVIILTGFGDLEAARQAIHLDVVEFLTKPCTLGSLEQALERARSRRKSHVVEEAAARPQMQFDASPVRVRPISGRAAEPESAKEDMENIERRHILRVLEKQGGNRAATAAELGISLRKLYYRLGEYQKKGLI